MTTGAGGTTPNSQAVRMPHASEGVLQPPTEEAHLAGRIRSRRIRMSEERRSASEPRMLAREPLVYVLAGPTHCMSAKSLFLWKSSDHRQCSKDPAVTAGEACDVVGGQELVPRGKWFIDPPGDRNRGLRRKAGRSGRLIKMRTHKRPVMCGSGRLGTSCHSGASVTPHRQMNVTSEFHLQNWGRKLAGNIYPGAESHLTRISAHPRLAL